MKKKQSVKELLIESNLDNFKNEDYFFTHVEKSSLLIFIGQNIKINAENIFNLKPNDKICQVGQNRGTGKGSGMAALNRYDIFDPYVTYIGTREEPLFNKLLMFKIRDEDKPKEIRENDDYYIAYEILNEDLDPILKVYDHRANVPRIFKPIFTHFIE